MEVVLSQMRWPAEVYRSLKAKAKEKEVSINALVVEAVKRMLSVDEKSPGAQARAEGRR